MISCPFHKPFLKFAPVLSQKLEEIHLVMSGAHFLQLYRKKKYGDPIFPFFGKTIHYIQYVSGKTIH